MSKPHIINAAGLRLDVADLIAQARTFSDRPAVRAHRFEVLVTNRIRGSYGAVGMSYVARGDDRDALNAANVD